MMAILSRSFDVLRTYIGSFTWGPFVQISRSTVLGLLQRVEIGQLVIVDCDGSVTTCGNIEGKTDLPTTQLKVLKEAFWVRVLLFADMVRPVDGSNSHLWGRADSCCIQGFAESFMLGEFSCPDLTAFFRVCDLNFPGVEPNCS